MLVGGEYFRKFCFIVLFVYIFLSLETCDTKKVIFL